jgi:hypothetical protein
MSWRAGPLAPPSLGKLFHTRTWSHLHLERCRSTTPLCIRGWRTSSCTIDQVSGARHRVPSQALGPGTHRRSCLPMCLCNKEIRSESQLSQLQACQTFDLEIYIWDLYTIISCVCSLPTSKGQEDWQYQEEGRHCCCSSSLASHGWNSMI